MALIDQPCQTALWHFMLHFPLPGKSLPACFLYVTSPEEPWLAAPPPTPFPLAGYPRASFLSSQSVLIIFGDLSHLLVKYLIILTRVCLSPLSPYENRLPAWLVGGLCLAGGRRNL